MYKREELELARKNYKAALDSGKAWFNCREIGDMLQRSQTWAWNQIRSGRLKAEIDKTRGVSKKYYIVHIDQIGKLLDSFKYCK